LRASGCGWRVGCESGGPACLRARLGINGVRATAPLRSRFRYSREYGRELRRCFRAARVSKRVRDSCHHADKLRESRTRSRRCDLAFGQAGRMRSLGCRLESRRTRMRAGSSRSCRRDACAPDVDWKVRAPEDAGETHALLMPTGKSAHPDADWRVRDPLLLSYLLVGCEGRESRLQHAGKVDGRAGLAAEPVRELDKLLPEALLRFAVVDRL